MDASDARSIFEGADIVRDTGNSEEAEQLYTLALHTWDRQCSRQGRRAHDPPHHQFTVKIINALACAIAEGGKLDKAEHLLTEALRMHRAHTTESEAAGESVANILQNLGELAVARTNWKRAEKLYTASLRATRVRVRRHNRDQKMSDKILSCSLARLAMISVELEKHEKALFYLSEWYSATANSSLCAEVQDQQIEAVTRALCDLAHVAEKHGSMDKAEMLYRTCLSVLRRSKSSELPPTAFTADVLYGLGTVLLLRVGDAVRAHQENLQVAGYLLKESLRIRAQSSNTAETSDERSGDDVVVTTVSGLALVARQQGRLGVAARLLLQGLIMRRFRNTDSVLDLEDTHALLIRANTAETAGRLLEARELYEQCLSQCLERDRMDRGEEPSEGRGAKRICGTLCLRSDATQGGTGYTRGRAPLHA